MTFRRATVALVACALAVFVTYWWSTEASGPQPEGGPAGTRRAVIEPGQPAVAREETAPGPGRKENLATIIAIRDPVDATRQAANHFLTLPPGEFPGAFGLLLAQPASLRRDELLRYLLRQWGRTDRAAAMATISKRPGFAANDRAKFTDLVLEGWVTRHADEAWSWALRSLPELPVSAASPASASSHSAAHQRPGGSRENRMKSLVAALVESGQHRTAARLLGTAPEDGLATPGSGYAEMLVRSWYPVDPEAARAWVESLSASTAESRTTGRSNGIRALATAMVLNDQAAALRYAERLKGSADFRFIPAGLVAGWGAQGDRLSAYRWLAENVGENPAPGDGLPADYDLALARFFEAPTFPGSPVVDAEGEFALLARIRTVSMRSQSAWAYAVRTLERDPAKAMEAVQTFVPENNRERYLQELRARVARATVR